MLDGQISMGFLGSGAEFSICRKYRYKLWREWDMDGRAIAFIGLNPSTADEVNNDPTVRRCINYAKDWGFGRFIMLNIFGYRATDPKDMKAQSDPVGPGNMEAIGNVASGCDMVVACWGVHGEHMGQGEKVFVMLEEMGVSMMCLGATKAGHPRHPLYLRKDLKPFIFDGYER